jgi:two-component system, OmpR family, response regulator YxdJ
MKYKVLIIEDEEQLAHGLKSLVERDGMEGFIVRDLQNPINDIIPLSPHIILLDINLPYFNGFYWCRKIRSYTISPIIMISARDAGSDQVLALENGADDYICKPFDNEVVMAKIRSHIRRTFGEYYAERNNSLLIKNGIELDLSKMTMKYLDNSTMLSPKEMSIMWTLVEKSPNVVKRDILTEKVWDDKSFVDENTLSVNIARLRAKLKEIGLDDVLHTIRGLGYTLEL